MVACCKTPSWAPEVTELVTGRHQEPSISCSQKTLSGHHSAPYREEYQSSTLSRTLSRSYPWCRCSSRMANSISWLVLTELVTGGRR